MIAFDLFNGWSVLIAVLGLLYIAHYANGRK